MDLTSFITTSRDRALQLGDYSTYRSQLSRSILSLRTRLGRATPKNSKFATKAPITAEDIGKSHDFAKLLVLQAERAWAHATYIKQQHTQNEGGKALTGQGRSHVLSRLAKAAFTARLLVDALNDQDTTKATNVDLLEAIAYARMLSGTEHFEKQANGRGPQGSNAQSKSQRWAPCLNELAVVQVVYTALLRHTKNEVYKEVLGGIVDPMFKYAGWQATGNRNAALPALAKDYFPQSEKQTLQLVRKIDPDALQEQSSDADSKAIAAVPTTISWRSRKANILDGSIGQALTAVATAETRLKSFLSERSTAQTRDKASAYDDVIIASQDATDATRRAIEDLEKEGVNEGDPRMQDLRVTSLAVNYDMVAWRVGRNRILIDDSDGLELNSESTRPKKRRKTSKSEKEESTGRTLGRLRQRVHLYEEIIQSIDSVKQLRGAVRDATFVDELDSKRAYFQALKCVNIAYSHDLVSNPRNALALLVRAESLLAESKESGPQTKSESDAPLKLDVSSELRTNLQGRVKRLVTQHRGLVELHNLNENSRVAAKKNMTSAAPIVERLHDYPAGGVDLENLVTYPPKLKPVPVKPIFLDVAWNYIDYPGRLPVGGGGSGAATLNGSKDTEMGDGEKPAKKGWFGFGR